MLKGLKKKQRQEEWITPEEYEINTIDTGEEKARRIKKSMNIVFIIAVVIMMIITIDVICVSRYQVGPFFAIRTNVYKDGGTKVYYGLGYKVIKYHQTQGRRDTKIGFWSMPYSVEPTTISSLDLAIELRNHPNETYQKFYGKFLRVDGIVSKIDKTKNQLTLQYTDPDDAYTLKIICQMAEKDFDFNKVSKNNQKTIIGTVTDFTLANKKTVNTLKVSNCFTE